MATEKKKLDRGEKRIKNNAKRTKAKKLRSGEGLEGIVYAVSGNHQTDSFMTVGLLSDESFAIKNEEQKAEKVHAVRQRLVFHIRNSENENIFIRKRLKTIASSKKYLNYSWQIESLFGIKIDKEFLTIDFVENLFKNADFEFYVNKAETHIFSQKNELLEHDFGKLKSISALEAFQKYGIELLEKAKEKVYVKLSVENA